MIQITNISQQAWFLSNSHRGGSRGEPVYMRLPPASKGKNWLRILDKQLATYDIATKQALAQDCELGLIQLHEMNGVHVGLDLTQQTTSLTSKPLLPPDPNSTALTPILNACATWKKVYNEHVLSEVYHTTADAAPLVAALPTTELQVIAFVTTAKAIYNAHLANAIHPTADTSNLLGGGAPVTYSDALIQFQKIINLFQQHKTWAYDVGNPPLNPPAIITFT